MVVPITVLVVHCTHEKPQMLMLMLIYYEPVYQKVMSIHGKIYKNINCDVEGVQVTNDTNTRLRSKGIHTHQ